jgi:hypothetical protein
MLPPKTKGDSDRRPLSSTVTSIERDCMYVHIVKTGHIGKGS